MSLPSKSKTAQIEILIPDAATVELRLYEGLEDRGYLSWKMSRPVAMLIAVWWKYRKNDSEKAKGFAKLIISMPSSGLVDVKELDALGHPKQAGWSLPVSVVEALAKKLPSRCRYLETRDSFEWNQEIVAFVGSVTKEEVESIKRRSIMSKVYQVSDENFDQEIIHSNMPVIVDFWADWCEPCKAMAPEIEGLAQKYQGKIKFAQMNVVNNRNIPARFGIRNLPTFMLFKRGEVLNTIIGAFPGSLLEEEVRKML